MRIQFSLAAFCELAQDEKLPEASLRGTADKFSASHGSQCPSISTGLLQPTRFCSRAKLPFLPASRKIPRQRVEGCLQRASLYACLASNNCLVCGRESKLKPACSRAEIPRTFATSPPKMLRFGPAGW